MKKRKKQHKTFIKVKSSSQQAERMREYIPVIDGSDYWKAKAYEKECCQSVIGRKAYKEEISKKRGK